MATLTLSFTHDLKNVDGSDFDGTQYAGVEYSIDANPFVSVPAAFAVDGAFTAQADVDLPVGDYAVSVKLKHIDGTASEASDAAFFTVAPRVPSRPSGLSASYSR